MTRLIAVILFCAGIFCIAAEPPVGQSHAQVPMTGAGLGKPAGGGGAAVTWDPANTDSNITLSGGNLTAAANPSSVNYLSRATASVGASSKIYWEVLSVVDPGISNDIGLGFVDSSFTIPQNNFLGFDSHSFGAYNSNAVFTGGSQVATWDAYLPGNVVSIAVDTVHGNWWGRAQCGGLWNSDPLALPDTNTNGLAFSQIAPLFPALVFRQSGPSQVTAQFSAASFSCTPPAGFTHL